MGSVRDRIEDLLKQMDQFRESPETSGFTDVDHLLTHAENVLEDCMVELLDLPIAEHRSLLDRVITSVDKLGKIGEAVNKLLNLFLG